MRKYTTSNEFDGILIKLSKKDRKLYEQLLKKIDEIMSTSDVNHYKNLRYDMKDSKRVHIGHFVLIFQYDETMDAINLDYFDHRDRIYGKK